MTDRIDLATVLVDDYDRAIRWFVGVLGFELEADAPATTTDGRGKRWVVVRPVGGGTGLLLARADGEPQRRATGGQAGGRVAFFLRTHEFDRRLARLRAVGATIEDEPRQEPYGRVVVFADPFGNRWDLIEGLPGA